MTCHRIGRSPTWTMGLGTLSLASLIRMPSPPQNRTTFIGTVPQIYAAGRSQARVGQSRTYCRLGNGNNELPSPLANVAHLLHDLSLQVPGQDQQIIRPGLTNPFRRINGNMRARSELTVLVRIAVHRVVDKIRSHSAVVQQRIAFAGSAVSNNGFALPLGLDQALQKLALGVLDLFRERAIAVEIRQPRRFLSRLQFQHPRGYRLGVVLTVASI